MPDIDRKLATIRKISRIDPIPGADRIELISIDGWHCIAQKDQGHEIGSLVCYFEVDSFLPVREEFEFLRPKCFKSTKNLGDGFRIQTMKMKGVVSQGLILPINLFPELMDSSLTNNYVTHVPLGNDVIPNFNNGYDVTEILKIQKYEKPISANLAGTVKGNFPSFIPKTDQERYQNIPEWKLECYKSEVFEVSIKMDGSSMTVYIKDGEFGVCSRNLELKDDAEDNFKVGSENLFWKVAKSLNLKEKMRELNNVALQGELCGPGIQGNPQKLTEHKFFVFDIYDIIDGEYLTPLERHFMINNLKLDHVPITCVGKLNHYIIDREHMIKSADLAKFNDIDAEGLVFKSNDGKFSFKIISPKYLLAND